MRMHMISGAGCMMMGKTSKCQFQYSKTGMGTPVWRG